MTLIWKLRHHLFGTHFIVLKYGYDDFVRAIRWTPVGRPYVRMYGEFIWLDGPRENWHALTFDKTEFQNRLRSPSHLQAVK